MSSSLFASERVESFRSWVVSNEGRLNFTTGRKIIDPWDFLSCLGSLNAIYYR